MNIKDYEWIDSENWKAYGMAILLILLPLIINNILKKL